MTPEFPRRSRLRRVLEHIPYLRLTPYDTTTAAGRGQERYRRVVLSTLAAGAVRSITLITTLAIIPLSVRYLGTERFGVLATITATIGLLAFADLGLGSGLVNAIAERSAHDDRHATLAYISSTFVTLTGLALALCAVFIVIYAHVPWAEVLNTRSRLAGAEAGPALAVFTACFLASLPLGVAQRVHIGFQESFLASAWVGMGNVISLVGTLVAISQDAGVPWLVLTVCGGPVIAALLNSVVLFFVQRPWLRPRLSAVSSHATRRILKFGLLFFALGVAGAIGYESDSLVIARILGPESVTQYAVAFKLFFVAPAILSLVLLPLWPAYGEALSRGDVAWAKKTLRRTIKLGFVVNVPIAATLVFFGNQVIHAWVGEHVTAPPLLLFALGLWAFVNSVNGPIAMFLNGANVIRFQVICASTMAVVNLGLSIILANTIGVSGVVFGTVLAQFATIIVPSALHIRKFFNRLERASAPAGVT